MSEISFEHGVASGDPLTDAVVIWTRVTTGEERVAVSWRLGADPELRDIVVSGEASADAEHDHCVSVDVDGLVPGTTYWYGFAAGGVDSPVARTRTLPAGDVQRLRFAMCSCAKFNAGYFNAYARIAEREDLDFLLHLGDYIYEASQTPPASQTQSLDIGRPFDPLDECRTLADYRTRYAQYRRDPDVQALHHALPVIAAADDHELADGAWGGGATEHREAEHGPWSERRDAAFRARWEWMPARMPDPADPARVFRGVSVGSLADIFLVDIRSRRDEPVIGREMQRGDRTMLGAEQRDWLFEALGDSTSAWRLLGTPSILTRTWVDGAAEPLRGALLKLKLMDEDGEGPDEDQWDGYPAEREALLDVLEPLEDVVVLSSDIHVCVAAEVRSDFETVAVEITSPSLTSQNLDEKLGVEPRADVIADAERAFVAALDHIQWTEFSGHGYVLVDVDEERLRAEWWLVDTVLERADGERCAAAFEVPRGAPRLRPG